jgi:hypothetical protein
LSSQLALFFRQDVTVAIWQAWGKIVGPRLPETTLVVGNITIGPLPPGNYPSTLPLADPKPQTDLPYFVATAPRMHVTSPCWLIVHGIEADSSDAAARIAQTEAIPVITGLLSAGNTEQPYRVQFFGVQDEPLQHGADSFSDIQSLVLFETTPLSLSDANDILVTARNVVTANEHLLSATHAFSRGVTQSDNGGSAQPLAASVLAFYQVLEACAQVVPWEPAPDLEEQHARIARSLRDTLNSSKATRKKRAAIGEASRSLDRLDARYTTVRVDHAAQTFNLPKSWTNRARDLAKFRNTRLGHAGRAPSIEELMSWHHGSPAVTTSAYAIASTMLGAAIDYVRKR